MEERNLIMLIEKSKSGDLQALEELLQVSYATVAYKCRRMLGNEQDAQDLTQEVLLVVCSKLNTLEKVDAYWGWINRIATNLCYNFLERKHKDLQFSEDEDGNSILDSFEVLDERQIPDKAMDNAETARIIDEIVASLPDTQRAAVLMYYYDEMSIKEISRTMNVAEGTVKRRLDLARNKIEARIREYEKQGVKLYSVSVLPFLWYYLRFAAQSETNTTVAASTAAEIMAGSAAETASSTVSATAGTVSAAVSSGAGVTGGTAVHMVSTLSGKIIAGVVAAAISIGACTVAIAKPRSNDAAETQNSVETLHETETIPQTIQTESQEQTTLESQAQPEEVDPAADAYSAYEALLTRGTTDMEMQIAYYAYVGLNQDGVPELVVADADGTPTSWTSVEIYTYKDGQVQYCGATNSSYNYLYLVNDKYVLGTHRMGNRFITTDDSIVTTVYYWNEDNTRNDPAVFYGNGEWEYITAEEFHYYQIMPDDDDSSGFIQTAEPIIFKRNEFAPISSEAVLELFSAAKDFYDSFIYGRRYVDAKEDPIENFSWLEGVIEYDGCLYEPLDQFTYDEFVSQLHSFFTEDAAAKLIVEAGLMEYNGECYVYVREGVGDPCFDYEVTPQQSAEGYYEMLITITELDKSVSHVQFNCLQVEGNWLFDSGNFYGR